MSYYDSRGVEYTSTSCTQHSSSYPYVLFFYRGSSSPPPSGGTYYYRCYDVTSGSYLTSSTSTSETSIRRPSQSGYTYLGYIYYDSWSKCINAYPNLDGTGTTCSQHNSSNPYVVFFYEGESSSYQYRCYDVTSGSYLTSSTSTSSSSITRPSQSGYTYLGYIYYDSWSKCINAYPNLDGTGTTCSQHNSSNPYVVFFYEQEAEEVWQWDSNPRDSTYTGSAVATVNPGTAQIDYFYFVPPENGTLVIQSLCDTEGDDPYGWIALKGNLRPSGGTGNGSNALTGTYIARDDGSANDTYDNFKITVDLTKNIEYQIYVHDYSRKNNPAAIDVQLTWTPAAPATWQAPALYATVTNNTAYTATISAAAGNKATYVKYTTPAYAGKLICKTTRGISSDPDYYGHLSTAALTAGSGTARGTAVNTSATGYIKGDDDSGGAYDCKIVQENCPASTAYYFYVNAAFSETGTYSIPLAINYYRKRTITYNANGGSGAPGQQTFYDDNLLITFSTTVPTRSGYQFLGWSTSNTATSASYTAGETTTVAAQDYTLYAVWKTLTTYVTITYNANGGSGAPGAQQVEQGGTATINTSTTPTRSGFIFKGWATSSSDKTPLYKKGGAYLPKINANLTLYAVWWPNFNWDERNAVEGELFNHYVKTYVADPGNTTLTAGDLYTALWFNRIAAKLNAPPVEPEELITNDQLDELVDYYRNY